jgi:hypothetical protein
MNSPFEYVNFVPPWNKLTRARTSFAFVSITSLFHGRQVASSLENRSRCDKYLVQGVIKLTVIWGAGPHTIEVQASQPTG